MTYKKNPAEAGFFVLQATGGEVTEEEPVVPLCS